MIQMSQNYPKILIELKVEKKKKKKKKKTTKKKKKKKKKQKQSIVHYFTPDQIVFDVQQYLVLLDTEK